MSDEERGTPREMTEAEIAAAKVAQAVTRQVATAPVALLKERKEQIEQDGVWYCEWRIRSNVMNTGHPFHHLTADGTVVDADPGLERALRALAKRGRVTGVILPPFDLAKALPAIPVNRMFYGFAIDDDGEMVFPE